MRSRFILLFSIYLLAISGNSYAFKFSAEVCKQYGLGDNWYCEEEKSKEVANTPQDIMESKLAPEQKAESLNQLWELQRKRAVITGKKEDLENLLITQKFIAQLGTDFARNMMRLVESNPLHSVSESYYQSSSDEYVKAAQVKYTLEQAKERYAIAFVYSSNCPYCKRQLPILLSLQGTYQISVIGISVDGGFYEGLSENIYDNEAASDPNVRAYPTIMLLDSQDNKRIFISKGLTTKDQLEKRIYRRIQEIEAKTRNEG